MRCRPIVLVLLLLCAGCRTEGSSASLAGLERSPEPGLVAFVHDDLGALSREGLDRATIPWTLAAVGLLQRAERARGHALTRDSLGVVLREFGFLDPARIRNWSGPLARTPSPALGLLTGRVPLGAPGVSVDAAALGCASCHSSVLHDRDGAPTGEAWVGLPSSSISLGAYSASVFAALEEVTAHPAATMERVKREFPELGVRDRFVLRHVVIPRARKRLASLRARYAAALPFTEGRPGLTNGVAALKYYLRPDRDGIDWSREVALTAIPDLSARHLRSALLMDGAYAPRGAARGAAREGAADPRDPQLDSLAPVVTFFAVPALGVPPDRAVREVPRVREMLTWLSHYRTPPFPGEVDPALAAAGAELFRRHCADCHGDYPASGPMPRVVQRYPNRMLPLERIGTDPLRIELADSASGDAIARTPFDRYFEAERMEGYVAPILNGVWATAPYLHNGSVPTLWDLLTPDERPVRFPVGGHRLDFARMGIALAPAAARERAYPEGYRPWSRPEMHDVGAPGAGNAGHRFPAQGLNDLEKRRLIEYLKTL